MPTTIYDRDYNKLTPQEESDYQSALTRGIVQKIGDMVIRKDSIFDYPKAARHNISRFPGHYLDPADLRDRRGEFEKIIGKFVKVIEDQRTTEQDILKFIQEHEAYFMIGSIVKTGYHFGHHALYLFPEFKLNASYRPDYVLVGKNSDGYHFVFLELENARGRITKADGNFGEVLLKGIHQVEQWQHFLESQWASLAEVFKKALKDGETDLPNEFYQYDATRMNFVVIGGRRKDFSSEFTRRKRRSLLKDRVRVMHYDNLIDEARLVLGELTY